MTPNWNSAPEWAQYVAQDPDGTWLWFEFKPEARDLSGWVNTSVAYMAEVVHDMYYDKNVGNWRNTLQKRPSPEDKKSQGIFHIYNIERVDGRPMGDCIVLEFDDPNSAPALLTWADTVEEAGFSKLAENVREKLSGFEELHRLKRIRNTLINMGSHNEAAVVDDEIKSLLEES